MWKLRLLFVIALLFQTLSGQEDQKKIDEYVDVVHTEILLRAIRDGKTIGRLTEKDLVLYEDGKRVKISSMVEVKRRMKTRKIEFEVEREMIRKPRFFILYFWLSNRGNNIPEALNYFFSDIYSTGDQVILAVKDRVFEIREEEDIKGTREEFLTFVDGITKKMSEEIRASARQLEFMARDIRELIIQYENSGEQLTGVELKAKKLDLILHVIHVKKFYLRKYFVMNDRKLMDLSSSIKDINMEKWGILFFQPPTYPFVDTNNLYVKKILNMFSNPVGEGDNSLYLLKMNREELLMKMGTPENLLGITKIRQAFFEADATFHMIQLDADTSTDHSQEFVRKYHIGNKWETAFRKVVEATGGLIESGKHIREAMNRIAEREDIHYVLTYQPNDARKMKRKISFKSKKKGIKLFHHRRGKIETRKDITVENIAYQFPVLRFNLKNYRMKYQDDQLSGNVMLNVTAIDSQGKKEHFAKEFKLDLEDVEVSFTLHLIQGEKYEIYIDVLDVISKKTARAAKHIKIPENPAKF